MNPNRTFAAALAATDLPWEAGITTAILPGTEIRASLTPLMRHVAVTLYLRGASTGRSDWSISATCPTAPEALATLAPALPPKPAPRPTCILCNTDADAPTVERPILTRATIHHACCQACYYACDGTPEPGDAVDAVPDFIEAHLPDAPDGSLRHAEALARLSGDYPGILTIAAALKAAQ